MKDTDSAAGAVVLQEAFLHSIGKLSDREYRSLIHTQGGVAVAGLLQVVSPELVSTEGTSFFEGTTLSERVLAQVDLYHNFPESVAAFEDAGVVTELSDGATMLEIPGEYGNDQGVFEFIKNAENEIYHWWFNPDP